MLKINLVPEVQEEKQKTKNTNSMATFFAVGIFAACILVLLMIGGFWATQKTELTVVKSKTTNVNEELEQYKDLEKEVISLEKGLDAAKQILNGGNPWSRLLTHLEAATPADTRYKTIKFSGNSVEATAEGKNISSVSKFIESYKSYEVISFSGTTDPNTEVTVIADGAEQKTTSRPSGAWKLALKIESAKDHQYKIKLKDKEETINYTAEGQKIDNQSTSQAVIKNLFSSIESQQYRKADAGVIEFSIKYNFEKELLW